MDLSDPATGSQKEMLYLISDANNVDILIALSCPSHVSLGVSCFVV